MHAIHPRAAALARAFRGRAQEALATEVRFCVLFWWVWGLGLQGYLARKKHPPPRTLQ